MHKKLKLKQQVSTTYPLEWQKFKTKTTPNADEEVEKQELSFTADGSAKHNSHSGRQCGSSLNILNFYFNTLD